MNEREFAHTAVGRRSQNACGPCDIPFPAEWPCSWLHKESNRALVSLFLVLLFCFAHVVFSTYVSNVSFHLTLKNKCLRGYLVTQSFQEPELGFVQPGMLTNSPNSEVCWGPRGAALLLELVESSLWK